jgi:hypothetical protein
MTNVSSTRTTQVYSLRFGHANRGRLRAAALPHGLIGTVSGDAVRLPQPLAFQANLEPARGALETDELRERDDIAC